VFSSWLELVYLVWQPEDYQLPRLKTKFGERAFSHAGPSAWNALPSHIRDVSSSNSFRKILKTHYFTLAFNVR